MASAKQSIPFVVPAPVVPRSDVITQNEVALLLSMRGRLHQLADQLEAAEKALRARLERGAIVEEGDHTARLEEHFRASIAWKDKAIDLADRLGLSGPAWAQNVAHTTKTRTVSLFIE